MNQLLTVEVADFVEAVDACLADLPEDVRAELLDDLPAHLADVLADGGTPRKRLGTPEQYAAELRSAAGYPSSGGKQRRPSTLLIRARRADERIGTAIGYRRLSDLVRALAPAWWLLRAYLALQLLTDARSRGGAHVLVPELFDSVAFGLVALVALAGLSVWIGRRSHGRGALVATAIISCVLVVSGLVLVDHATSPIFYVDDGNDNNFDTTTNIYPVGPDGKVIDNVRLYDQDGNPIYQNISPCEDGSTGTQFDPTETSAPLYPIVCATSPGPFSNAVTPAPLPSTSVTSTTSPTVSPSTTPAAPATTPAPATSEASASPSR